MPNATRQYRLTRNLSKAVFGLALLATTLSVKPASISGIVRDTDRQPVPNASVVAVNLTQNALATESKTKIMMGVTDFDGQFRFSDLPPGTYRICVEKAHAQLLNPCQWGTPPEVVLVDEKADDLTVIAVSFGKLLRVRIDDPEEALGDATTAKQNDPFLGVAVLDSAGVLHDLRPQPSGQKGKEFEILVPADTALQLVVNSRNAEFEQSAAETKTKLSKDHAKIPFTAESSATVEKVLRLEMRREEK